MVGDPAALPVTLHCCSPPLAPLPAAGSARGRGGGGGWKCLCKAGRGNWERGVILPSPPPSPAATTGKRLFLINTLWLMLSFSLVVVLFFFSRPAFFPLQNPEAFRVS